jgi:hypothetical protein
MRKHRILFAHPPPGYPRYIHKMWVRWWIKWWKKSRQIALTGRDHFGIMTLAAKNGG